MAFIRHNSEQIGKGLQSVLENLYYADLMDNRALVMRSYLKVLQMRIYKPIMDAG